MLEVRSANLMALAAALPRTAERADMRYQWISRFIDNEHVVSDEVMAPFAIEVLEQAANQGGCRADYGSVQSQRSTSDLDAVVTLG